MPDLEYEKAARKGGFNLICGVDEAGRGPLAGPVCAAAVILPEDCVIDGLNDSKKLSEKKREELFPIIKEKAIAYLEENPEIAAKIEESLRKLAASGEMGETFELDEEFDLSGLEE